MTLFARCFLLVFAQLGVGGFLALAVPPFHDLARGFYKSSAGVFWFCGAVGGGGTIYLHLTRGPASVGTFEALLWTLFLLLAGAYWAALWTEAERPRARLYTASLAAGFAALVWNARAVTPDLSVPWRTLAVAETFAAAAALGSVTTGMLIGHWYLIDPGMEIEPFRKCFRFYVRAVLVEGALLLVVLAAAVLGDSSRIEGFQALALGRLLLCPVAALGIASLTARVLAIPQTMAATGLFYIATLAVLVASFLGRYFTFRTGLPF